MTQTDKFTKNFKVPEVLAQARRQLKAMAGTEFKGIRWIVADEKIAADLNALFARENINITVVYVKAVANP